MIRAYIFRSLHALMSLRPIATPTSKRWLHEDTRKRLSLKYMLALSGLFPASYEYAVIAAREYRGVGNDVGAAEHFFRALNDPAIIR
jgi:hypothetical protein